MIEKLEYIIPIKSESNRQLQSTLFSMQTKSIDDSRKNYRTGPRTCVKPQKQTNLKANINRLLHLKSHNKNKVAVVMNHEGSQIGLSCAGGARLLRLVKRALQPSASQSTIPTRVLVQILLMIRLGIVEISEHTYLRGDGSRGAKGLLKGIP